MFCELNVFTRTTSFDFKETFNDTVYVNFRGHCWSVKMWSVVYLQTFSFLCPPIGYFGSWLFLQQLNWFSNCIVHYSHINYLSLFYYRSKLHYNKNITKRECSGPCLAKDNPNWNCYFQDWKWKGVVIAEILRRSTCRRIFVQMLQMKILRSNNEY